MLTIVFSCLSSDPQKIPLAYAHLNSKLAILQSSCIYCISAEDKLTALSRTLCIPTAELIHKLRLTLEKQEIEGFIHLLQSTKDFFVGSTQQHCPDHYALFSSISCLLLEQGFLNGLQQTQNYLYLMQPHLFPDWQDAYIFLREIITKLFSETSQSQSYVSENLFNRILRFVDDHQGEYISLSDLSIETGYNTSYLSHFFKTSAGVPFSKYVAEKKLSYIKQLMLNKKLSLNDIARQSGFESRSYFNRFIKRMTGLSPQEMRCQ